MKPFVVAVTCMYEVCSPGVVFYTVFASSKAVAEKRAAKKAEAEFPLAENFVPFAEKLTRAKIKALLDEGAELKNEVDAKFDEAKNHIRFQIEWTILRWIEKDLIRATVA